MPSVNGAAKPRSTIGSLKVPKDYRPWVTAALRVGATLSQGRHAHPKLTFPNGTAIAVPTSPGNPHTFRSWLTTMKRALAIEGASDTQTDAR